MRIIKFRGKDYRTGEWHYGNLYAKDTYGRTHIYTSEHDYLDIDPETVGQFIGLYDKDDKEIYEGDILDFNGIKAEVRFVRGVFAFLENGDLDRELFGDCRTDLFAKVIGNVYERSKFYHEPINKNLKYKLTDECINVDNVTLYRIEALKDFADVKNGDKGGFVESEKNLSQINDCWVYGNAKVCQDARVSGNAKICDNAVICGNAHVYGDAKVCQDARVSGNAKICDNAVICGNAHVYGDAKVYEDAYIFGNTKVYENAEVYGNAVVYRDAKIYGDAKIYDYASVCDDSLVYGNAKVYDYARICEYAVVTSNYDYNYMTFKNVCPNWKYFTWTRSNNMWNVGYFYGTGEKLIEKAYTDSELSDKERKQIIEYVESIKQQNLAVEK